MDAKVTVEEMVESINIILNETRLPLTQRCLRAARNYAQAHSDGQAAALQSQIAERDAQIAEMLKVTKRAYCKG